MGMRCDGVDVLGKQQGDDAAATVALSGVSVEVKTFSSGRACHSWPSTRATGGAELTTS